MEYRRFGRTLREVSVIGQGTWNHRHRRPRDDSRCAPRGRALGLTPIDTAQMYGAAEKKEEAIA